MKEKNKVAITISIIGLVGTIIAAFEAGEKYAIIQQYEYWNEQIVNINESWSTEIKNTNEFWMSQISNIEINNNNIINNYPIEEEDIEGHSNNIEFTVESKVRFADNEDKTWYKNINANIGDVLEFHVEYTNCSDIKQEDVIVKNILPENLQLFSESVKYYNDAHRGGATLINGNAFIDSGVNVGSYTSGSNVIFRFKVKIIDNGTLSYGSNTLVNYGLAQVNGKIISDSVNININKNSEVNGR